MERMKNRCENANTSMMGTDPSTADPRGAVPAKVLGSTPGSGTHVYGATPDGTTMNNAMIGTSGGGQPVSVVQPYLAINYIIALQGIFPSRG